MTLQRGGAVLAAAAVLAASACGGGRLSHGDFVRRADAVCTAYDAQVQVLTRPESLDRVVAYADRTLALYASALTRLETLEPPRQDEPAVRTWLAADRAVAAALRRLRAAALRHDLAGTNRAATALLSIGAQARNAAAALGLHVCARA